MGSTSGSGIPEQPETVDLVDPTPTRASGWRRRPRGRIVVALIGVAVLVAGGIAVAVAANDDGSDTEAVDTFAPTVTVGDANLVVLATTFDAQGARHLVPPSLVTKLEDVPGVKAAEGVLRSNVAMRDPDGETLGHGRSTIALSWNGTAGLQLREGRPPEQTGEVAIDVGTLAEYDLQVGDEVRVDRYGGGVIDQVYVNGSPVDSASGAAGEAATIVGAFAVAGDDSGVPGVAVTAFDANTLLGISRGTEPGFDRADLIAADGADLTKVLTDVTAALPAGFQVVPASELGTHEQLRAELEIQRAFFDLLSLDEPTRNAAVEGADLASPEARAEGNRTFQRYLSQLVNVEFRVQRVSFTDADHANLVFMTYYDGSPSPVLTQPFDAHAVQVDGRWKVSSSTVCTLTLLGGAPCIPQPGQSVEPPPGWELPSTQPELVDAFTRTSTPVATVVVSGVRLVDADHADVFYSVTAPQQPGLETPYPLTARATLVAGHWEPDAPVSQG
jgi:hypothetical protein